MQFTYSRRKTDPVQVGEATIGGDSPILIQSMTTTPTEDTTLSVEQIIRIADAGGEMVRLTAQGESQAQNLSEIHAQVRSRGYTVPLVADIHFNPKAALTAARYVEKVRINPGNFIDKRADFTHLEFTDEQYAAELERLRDKFVELLEVCRTHSTALRIGVNHGSLSDRIMSRYGDTPQGMVESAMEFLRICRDEHFSNVVVSMKSSNPRVMVEAYRRIVIAMQQHRMCYPLHLGVTEAGEGEDGRIRSAVGIGALLADGIGDTIRVSLTEEPENEIPVARLLANYFVGREMQNYIPVDEEPLPYDPLTFNRRSAWSLPVVVAQGGEYTPSEVATVSASEAIEGYQGWIDVRLENLGYNLLEWLEEHPERVLVLSSSNSNWVGEIRACFVQIMRHKLLNPIVIKRSYEDISYEKLQLYAAADFGALFIDGLGDGMWIESQHYEQHNALSLSILQASRLRISKSEIISCPGCGRTLFDLPTTARAVKERLGAIRGLKIAVMGCIVNGPGEMADADFGYVGAGRGLVTLYKGREVVERNIPQNEALSRLVELVEREWHR